MTRAWAVALALSLVCAGPGARELEPVAGTPWAPQMVLKDLDGKQQRLDDYPGQVLVVNFWATWCPPCVAEMPGLQRLQNSLSDRPFTVLAVSNAEGGRRVRHFQNRMQLDFTFLLDPDGNATEDWGIDFLPTSLVVDGLGRLRYRAFGEVDWDSPGIRQLIHELLDEHAGP